MKFDWQTIAVALIIAAAALYVSRRALARLRAFRATKGNAAACETGCGSCGEPQKVQATTRTVFVDISRTPTVSRRK
jgi:hypothetical protein